MLKACKVRRRTHWCLNMSKIAKAVADQGFNITGAWTLSIGCCGHISIKFVKINCEGSEQNQLWFLV